MIPELLLNNTRDATPEEVDEWMETDFFMSGNFSAMQLFVVVPAIIQIVVFFTMIGAFALNSVIF
jgi:hypothetical protein